MEQHSGQDREQAASAMAHRWSRRQFLASIGCGTVATLLGAGCASRSRLGTAEPLAVDQAATAPVGGGFVLPPLPYAYNALEPHIDTLTMELHHSRHHQAYVDNLNQALANAPMWQNRDVVDILRNLDMLPQDIRAKVRNNGGGHLNHSIFWATMGPGKGGEPSGELATAIASAFGSFAALQAQMSAAAATVFGSSWVWLVHNPAGQLEIVSMPNQDTPYMEGLVPLVGIDVWEHAYYLKYQNRRAEYISAWWNVVNWDAVAQRFTLE